MAGLRELNHENVKKFFNHELTYDSVEFDPLADELIIFFVENNSNYISHDLNDNISLLYNPKDNEVIGFMIENFQYSFLKDYPDAEAAWSKFFKKAKGIQSLTNLGENDQRRKNKLSSVLEKVAEPILYGQ